LLSVRIILAALIKSKAYKSKYIILNYKDDYRASIYDAYKLQVSN